jgi:low affinity Fe/Cu permease
LGRSPIGVWAVSGPAFHYSDTWQLIINTGTTIITFLMVFLIQNTQNRDTTAIQLKLDELIRANENARDQMLRLEDLTENQIKHLKESFGTAPLDAIRQPLEAAQKGLQRLPRISRRQKVASPEKARPFGREKMTILHRRATRAPWAALCRRRKLAKMVNDIAVLVWLRHKSALLGKCSVIRVGPGRGNEQTDPWPVLRGMMRKGHAVH